MRDFLEKNKIYFNTVSTLLVSIAAVAVAYTSLTVSRAQLEATYEENQPIFSIEEDEYENLTIKNIGSPIEEISVTWHYWHVISAYIDGNEVELIRSTSGPSSNAITKNRTGVVWWCLPMGKPDPARAVKYEEDLRETAKNMNLDFHDEIDVMEFNFVQIKYKDIYGNERTYYMEDNIMSGNRMLTESEAWKTLNDLSQASRNYSNMLRSLGSHKEYFDMTHKEQLISDLIRASDA